MRRALTLFPLVLACGTPADTVDDTDSDTVDAVACEATTPPALAAFAGPQDDGSFLSLEGREALAPGMRVVVEGFPSDVLLHPTHGVAYVTSTSNDDRRLEVIEVATGTVLQSVVRAPALWGLALSPDGSRLYAAGGSGQDVDVYEVGDDGRVTAVGSVVTGTYATGLTISPDGSRLWTGALVDGAVVEIDTEALEVVRTLPLSEEVFDLAYVPGRDELVLSDLSGTDVFFVDLDAWEEGDHVELGSGSAGLAVSPDGARVYVAVTYGDVVMSIETASRTVLGSAPVARDGLVDALGEPLLNSNPNDVWLDPSAGRLYVTRGADNAISVYDAEDLELLGVIPSGVYPTSVAVTADGATLVVAEGKGGGTGPNPDNVSAKNKNKGSVSIVDLDGLDLAATTEEARAQYERALDLFPFSCDGTFPVPDVAGEPTPIEHVVWIVKENKTLDALLGDLELPGLEVDPTLARWDARLTPNTRKLAAEFTIADNFYAPVEESDNGHLFLTTGHLTEYAERGVLEQAWSSRFSTIAVQQASVPEVGNLFTHLMDHGVGIRVFGEAVGMFATPKVAEGSPANFTDVEYPGGPFFNQGVEDEVKAQHVAMRIATEGLAPFTFMILPNDHTVGTSPGAPTPESMVADNDLGLGIVVEAIAQSPYWEKTVIFVVQDDPQSSGDHIDAHRTMLLVISPWAKRGYVSHTQSSFLSLFATVTRIFGIPPLGRPDASVPALWDMFTQDMDATPYTKVERTWPKEVNPAAAPGAEASMAMDFSGPDRNPDLAIVLDAYRLWRMGRLSEAEAHERVRARTFDPELLEELEEEAREERSHYDQDVDRLHRWAAERGITLPATPGRQWGTYRPVSP